MHASSCPISMPSSSAFVETTVVIPPVAQFALDFAPLRRQIAAAVAAHALLRCPEDRALRSFRYRTSTSTVSRARGEDDVLNAGSSAWIRRYCAFPEWNPRECPAARSRPADYRKPRGARPPARRFRSISSHRLCRSCVSASSLGLPMVALQQIKVWLGCRKTRRCASACARTLARFEPKTPR